VRINRLHADECSGLVRQKCLGLLNEVSPDKPTGTGARLFTDLINLDFITEINAGYGTAVPKPLQ